MELNVDNLVSELADMWQLDEDEQEDLRDALDERNVNLDWGATYWEFDWGDEEFMVLENVEDAETVAIQRVTQDLEEEPELFNKEWLNGLMNQRVPAGKSFLEFAAEDAVDTDGFAHFLNPYDGNFDETRNGFVVMRVN